MSRSKLVIVGGGAEAIRAKGLDAFRARVVLCDSRGGGYDRLTRWSRPGLLAIGDSAHAMSPAGGVGIDLAIQGTVAAVKGPHSSS